MTSIQSIIKHLLEEEEDDLGTDWKADLTPNNSEEVTEWLKDTLPQFGFEWRDSGCRSWEKSIHGSMASVGISIHRGHALLVRYRATTGNRWQNEEMLSLPAGDPTLNQLRKWRMIP